jgi:hypothetical protein
LNPFPREDLFLTPTTSEQIGNGQQRSALELFRIDLREFPDLVPLAEAMMDIPLRVDLLDNTSFRALGEYSRGIYQLVLDLFRDCVVPIRNLPAIFSSAALISVVGSGALQDETKTNLIRSNAGAQGIPWHL